MYNMGGWITSPGSCNKGFKSRPSGAAGKTRMKGLEVVKMKAKNPTATQAKTLSTRATRVKGNGRENKATAAPHTDSSKIHSIKDPSCPPHSAAN